MKNNHELGDAPIQSEYKDKMYLLAKMLDYEFNGTLTGDARKTGFIIMVFPFGNEDGRCNYISNGADRNDVIKLMEEQIKKFKGQ